MQAYWYKQLKEHMGWDNAAFLQVVSAVFPCTARSILSGIHVELPICADLNASFHAASPMQTVILPALTSTLTFPAANCLYVCPFTVYQDEIIECSTCREHGCGRQCSRRITIEQAASLIYVVVGLDEDTSLASRLPRCVRDC